MKWLGGRQSDNVEYSSGGGFGGRLMGGGIGAGIVGLIIYLITGYTPNQVDQMTRTANSGSEQVTENYHAEKGSAGDFASVVLAETEVIWDSLFRANGLTYRKPKMRLFNGVTESACGGASSAMGPFYCPEDNKIYLDVSFFNELKDRFSAPGDFANAYVIAHEVGHHIQYLLGTTEKMGRLRNDGGRGPHSISVMIELQADFYAGVWAHYAEKMNRADNPVVIERGDIEAALNAANAIGDDRLQQQTQGRIMPDAFTHGTSRQRMYWFKKGYQTGDMSQGNTFEEL